MKFSLRHQIVIIMLVVSSSTAWAAEEVNVYSYRQPFLTDPVFDEFTQTTGINVNTVFAKKGLVERLKNEGPNSPADLLLVANVGTLGAAVEYDLAQAVNSDTLNTNIPANFRDQDGTWFGLTARARIIVASKERIDPDQISAYSDLTKPEFKGRICTRSGKHPYMVELVSSIVAHEGEAAAKDWLAGVKENLARKPQGGDRAQVAAIATGECDIAIINSYYMGGMLKDPEQQAAAQSVRIIFPDQEGNGTHMNISGAILTKASPNRDNAIKLLEFLSSDTAQSMYATLNEEYPIKAGVEPSEIIGSWGSFKQDTLSLNAIVAHRAVAYRLADEVDYDG